MRFRVGARTDVGRVREGNEDSYMVHDPLYAVADGMGGHQGGEVASKLALETLGRMAGEPKATSGLAAAVREANRAVLEKAASDPGLAGMGTTLTALIAGERDIRLAHVGDSRAYLLRDGRLEQLTEDHTVVEGLVQQGRLTREEAEIHPQRSILTRALGVDGEIEIDEATHEVRLGDRLLLCSDGLTGMVGEDEIKRVLTEHQDPQAAADTLVDAANEAGGQDNITAVVIDVLDGGTPEAPAGAAATAPRPVVEPGQETARGGTVQAETPAAPRPARAPERFAAAPPPRRRRWARRVALWVVIPVVLIAAALWAIKALFIDEQWYVGVHEGRVAVFNGIPAEPLGIELSTVVEETDISADEISRFSDYRDVEAGITADSREDAKTVIAEMEQVLAEQEAREQRKERREP